ncbi:MAG: FtsQ-type POTRA domain-containing protein [Ruminococcaceae bacterium]|nr:FtsQ-type POTRA domain-containing protein [Oscillospiraceae bacterium]
MSERDTTTQVVTDEKSVFDVKDKKRYNKLRQWLLFSVIIVLCVGVVAWILITNLCKVATVDVKPTELYSVEDIIASAGIKEGDVLYSIDAARIEKKLEAEYHYLCNVKVSLVFPSSVSISFDEDMGDMCIKLGEEYYAINDEQRVIKMCSSPDDGGVHRITVVSDRIQRCVVGEKVIYSDDTLMNMVDQIIVAVEANGVVDKIDTIDMTDKFDISMDFDSRFDVKLGSTENIKYKIAMVVKVVEELYEDDIGQIDVRETSTAYVKLYNK